MSSQAINTTADAAGAAVAALVWEVKPEELVTYFSVTVLALVPLYIGCHMSLKQKKPAVCLWRPVPLI